MLQAWHEVDDAMTAYARAQQTRENAAATLAAERRALAIAQQRYDLGATDFLAVVAAQSAAIGGENAVVQPLA